MEALLEGRDAPIVQYNHFDGNWSDMTLANTGLPAADWSMPDERYRLKPDTITIIGKEYTAPLKAWPNGAKEVWSWSTGTYEPHRWPRPATENHSGWKTGLFFATEEQAIAVHDALISILTNGEHDAQK